MKLYRNVISASVITFQRQTCVAIQYVLSIRGKKIKKYHRRVNSMLCHLLADTVGYFPLVANTEEIACQAEQTDQERDLEFVDVEFGRDDNPHDGNDKTHYYEKDFFGLLGGKRSLLSYDHFIDIRKGMENALFDDFDGYSYHHR